MTKLDDYESIKMTFSNKSKETSGTEKHNTSFRKSQFEKADREEKFKFVKLQWEIRYSRPKISCFFCGKEEYLKRFCPQVELCKSSIEETYQK